MATMEYTEKDLALVSVIVNQLLSATGSKYSFSVKRGNYNRDGYFDERDERSKVFTIFLSEIPLITMLVRDIQLSDAEMHLFLG
ncbi:MAG: hypothetical protein KGL67_02275 [Patescibacteria group bacterium]|nr:hypothetical protein [Patescibacteria group bacterium]